jgi:hypothetical protein
VYTPLARFVPNIVGTETRYGRYESILVSGNDVLQISEKIELE